jgi:uncharacterized membrane protein YeaQ/YmgE (transglycosylase-associated protein family)
VPAQFLNHITINYQPHITTMSVPYQCERGRSFRWRGFVQWCGGMVPYCLFTWLLPVGSVTHAASIAQMEGTMGIIWTIIIGFLAGVIAKFLHPGSHEPSGFILTTVLGIVGALVATFLGQAIGWYHRDEGANGTRRRP